MFADDVDWTYSLVTSAQADAEGGPALAVAHLPYFARVTYEGLELMKRQRPTDAKAVELNYGRVIAAARHSAKLLDDTHKTFDSVVDELERIQADHRGYFSNSLLSVITAKDRLIASSRTSSYQTGWSLREATGVGTDKPHYDLAYEMGVTLAHIAKLFGHFPRATSLEPAQSLHGRLRDVGSSSFAKKHYGDRITGTEADALMMVEANVNSALIALEPSRLVFSSSVFRARFVALGHAASTLEQLLAGRAISAANSRALLEAIRSDEARRLVALRPLRNRCMHYGAPSTLPGLSAELPGYGLVEATSPGLTFAQVEKFTIDVLGRISAAFGDVRL